MRKARFKAAIALAHTTIIAWCEEQGITSGHLYQVLNGDRVSPPLDRKIDAFIETHLSAHAA